MKSELCFWRLLALVALALTAKNMQAQPQPDSVQAALYGEIAASDSLLFDAFNKRDVDRFASYFSPDLEFYHDKGGLTTYQHTIDFMTSVAKPENDLRRDLIKETLEVLPIPGYGAMEIGQHRFCHTENGKQDCGTFKFVHIWQKKDGAWKITRVVSYGH